MPKDKSVARFNFEVPEELAERLQRLPWGTRTKLMRILLEKIVESVEEHGEIMIGAIMSGEFTLSYVPAVSVPGWDSPSGRRK